MVVNFSDAEVKGDTLARLEGAINYSLSHCYQCGKCSAGCPAAYTMSAPPNLIIRYLQLGFYDRALGQNSYWVCSSCETCSARCPRGVPVKEVMEQLRHEAFRRGLTSGERPVVILHKVFLKTVQLFGRLHEPALIVMNNIFSGRFFKDFTLAPALVLKGKIKLLPPAGADRASIRGIFARTLKENQR